MTHRAPPAARELSIRGALLLAALLTALVLAEALVRAAGTAPDVVLIQAGRFRLSANPRLGYEPRPDVNYAGDSLVLYGFRGAGNSLGYRDYEHDVEKPGGVFRIVVLGDSLGAGLYVDRMEEVFPAILQELLRESGAQVEVINLSVAGYNTLQEVETLKDRGLRYEPDLVLLAYCLNDVALNEGGIIDTLVQEEQRAGGIPNNRVGNRWLVRSALYRFLRYRVFPSAPWAAAGGGADLKERVSSNTTEDAFHELRRVAMSAELPVLVAIFPELTDLSEYRYQGEHRRIASLSRELGFHSIDLLDIFKFCEAMIDGEIGYDRYHPTPPGHRCAAEAIAAFIEDKILNARSSMDGSADSGAAR